MALRYTDFTSGSDVRMDFLPRDRKPTVFSMLIILVCSVGLSVGLALMEANKMALISWLCLLLAMCGWYVIMTIVRSRDLVLATEFQNALFASALGFSNKFCLIITREGSIVYMDNGFQKMFPDLVKERAITVDTMLKHSKVEPSDREKIFAAIGNGVYDKLIFNIKAENDAMLKVVMSMEPIIRPSGFTLLRCREFVEKRTNDGIPDNTHIIHADNPMVNKASITLFAYVMDRMNTGVFITDNVGALIYANRLVEQWLAYKESEIIRNKLSLKDVVYQGNSGPDSVLLENFEGEAALRKKEGGLIKAFINQKVILGDDKKVLGCVAMVNNMVEMDPNIKKKLW